MKNIFKVLSMASVVMLVASCKHDEALTEPTLLDTFGEFSYKAPLTASQNEIGFGSGATMFFQAKFSIKTEWKLIIKGKNSGYIATLTGKDTELNSTTGFWDGRADVPVFPVDSAFATLSFPGNPERESQTVKVKVTSSKNIKSNPNYILVKDFALGKTGISFNPDPGDIGPKDFDIDTISGAICYSAKGEETKPNSYYMGGLAITPNAANVGSKYFPVVPVNAVADSDFVANTYFNVWVFGYGNPLAKITVQFKESDNDPGKSDGYQDPEDDAWEHPIYPTWEGWKQVSFKCNETVTGANPKFGGGGNKKRELNRISIVGFNIGTEAGALGKAELTIAYPVFSIGAPFNY